MSNTNVVFYVITLFALDFTILSDIYINYCGYKVKKTVCFIMGDIRCNVNLVYLVPIFLKFHTMIVIM